MTHPEGFVWGKGTALGERTIVKERKKEPGSWCNYRVVSWHKKRAEVKLERLEGGSPPLPCPRFSPEHLSASCTPASTWIHSSWVHTSFPNLGETHLSMWRIVASDPVWAQTSATLHKMMQSSLMLFHEGSSKALCFFWCQESCWRKTEEGFFCEMHQLSAQIFKMLY